MAVAAMITTVIAAMIAAVIIAVIAGAAEGRDDAAGEHQQRHGDNRYSQNVHLSILH